MRRDTKPGMEIGQIFRFVAAGSFAAAIYFVLMLTFLHLGAHSAVAALLAHFLAFFVGYTVQKRFAFRSSSTHSRSLPRYALLQLSCAGSAVLAATVSSAIVAASPMTVAAVTTVVLSGVSYVLSSRWVFVE